MIVFYSKGCEGCSGNQAIEKMKQHCKKQGVEFQERRTILWKVYEKEANEIMKLNEGLELPFFYSEKTGEVLEGDTFTPIEEIQQLVEGEQV